MNQIIAAVNASISIATSYSNLFRNATAKNDVNGPILPILILKSVAMATSLELSEKSVKSVPVIYHQMPTIW